MSYKKVPGLRGNFIEVTEGAYKGAQYSVDASRHSVRIANLTGDMIIVPKEALGWLRESLDRIAEEDGRKALK